MKLKEIPQNIAVRTPTEAEAKELLAILHEGGYKWLFGEKSLVEQTIWNRYEDATGYFIEDERVSYGDMTDRVSIEDYPIITLVEFKERYCEEEKPQPKFIKGQRVYCRPYGYPFVIADGIIYDNNEPHYYSENGGCYKESILEPYTEPETKPTEDMETKELNLAELLKGHEGEEFFLTTMGTVIFHGVSEQSIQFKPNKTAKDTYLLSSTGKMRDNGVILAYPSRVLYEQYPLEPYTAWMKWKEEQQVRNLRIILTAPDFERNYVKMNFRTPADRDKCLEEIKAIIEKYNKK